MAKPIPGVPGEPLYSLTRDPSKQQRLELLHYNLMVVYIYMIEKVSGSGRLPQRAATEKSSQSKESAQISLQSYKHRPIMKALVESHVKAKVAELRAIYAQIEQVTPDIDSAQNFRTWLKDSQDSLDRFSTALPVMTFARRIATALWPLIIAIAVVGTVWNTILSLLGKSTLHPIDTLVGGMLTGVGFLLFGVSIAARRKRRLFLGEFSISLIWPSIPPHSVPKNVYKAEDDLFDYIPRSKQPEFPLDVYALGTAAIIFAITDGLSLANPHFTLHLRLVYGFVAIFALLIGAVYIFLGHRRTPR